MKNLFAFIALLWSVATFAQNSQLAENYFDNGEYEKALSIYQELSEKQPGNIQFAQKIAECYQQLQQYDKAETVLQDKLDRTKQPMLLVELGYNRQLEGDTLKAKDYYSQALNAIKDNPGNVYTIANTFEKKVLLKQALTAYETATGLNDRMNFDFQMALLQGQLGNMEGMIDRLLSYSYNNRQNLPVVQNQLGRFMEEGTDDTFSNLLRKALLLRAQKDQDIFWNQFLSWYFIQQKEYGKAFIQQKAIFKRDPDTFYDIVGLARITVEENENDTAREILDFILQNSQDPNILLQAEQYLLTMDINAADEKGYPAIKTRIEALMKRFGTSPYTLALQIQKADFEAFRLKDTQAGMATLKTALNLPLNKYQEADVKMKLADILLSDEKFNQAIILYSQVEEDLKNDEVAHDASYKVARASYFKGDFDWAQKQLKVLKSSSSQLIANDALELFLLINDNTVEDSTQTALKKFARADFKLYQNKKDEALALFKDIHDNDPTKSIQDVTLLRMGKIYESEGKYDEALQQYKQIMDNYKDGIYIDEALYYSAEIYNKKLQDPEKAKPLYEKVLFEHQDSIYFVDARKEYRKLRGDANT